MRNIGIFVLYQVVFGLFQTAAYAAKGWYTLVGAWGLILALTWIEEKSLTMKIIQTIIQTIAFLALLGFLSSGMVKL
ncbi:MAG: hypothetical protein P8182_16795 [Deltaproteobacteria bacterium]